MWVESTTSHVIESLQHAIYIIYQTQDYLDAIYFAVSEFINLTIEDHYDYLWSSLRQFWKYLQKKGNLSKFSHNVLYYFFYKKNFEQKTNINK